MEIFWAQVIKSLAEMTGPDATFDRLNIFPEAQILSEAVWRFRSFIIIWAVVLSRKIRRKKLILW